MSPKEEWVIVGDLSGFRVYLADTTTNGADKEDWREDPDMVWEHFDSEAQATEHLSKIDGCFDLENVHVERVWPPPGGGLAGP